MKRYLTYMDEHEIKETTQLLLRIARLLGNGDFETRAETRETLGGFVSIMPLVKVHNPRRVQH